MAEHLTCGDEADLVDLYGESCCRCSPSDNTSGVVLMAGLNNYEWCGNQTLQTSNWGTITRGFEDIPVATYMSEYGCIFEPPRLWTEVAALAAPPVSDVFSGGVAFSYFPTSDGYGMVTFSGDDGQR